MSSLLCSSFDQEPQHLIHKSIAMFPGIERSLHNLYFTEPIESSGNDEPALINCTPASSA